MTPDEMSTVLRDELAAGKFYVIGFDEGRKRHTFPIISTAQQPPLPLCDLRRVSRDAGCR